MKIIILTLTSIILSSAMLPAQITREEYLAQLEAYKKSADAGLATFFNKNQSASKRIEAISKIDRFTDEEDIKRCMDIVMDVAQPDEVRAAAIFKVRYKIHHHEAARNKILTQIEQSYAPPKFREAAMDVMQMYVFKPQTPESERQKVMTVFRKIGTNDSRPQFRERAMYVLTTLGDSEARRILSTGLKDPTQAVIAPDKAINLLAGVINNSEYYYELIQNILNNPPTQAAQLEAIRALGNYEPARDDILKVLENKRAAPELRIAAMNGLNASLGDDFFEFTKSVILDEDAPEELRIRGLQSQLYREVKREMESPSTVPLLSPEFDEVIEQLKRSKSESVKNTAAYCARKLKKE